MKLPDKAIIDTHTPTGIAIYGYTAEQMREMYRQGLEAALKAVRDLDPDNERCKVLMLTEQAWCEALEDAETAILKLMEEV